MKQPLAGVAGLFAAGILLGWVWTPPPWGLLACTAGLGIFAAFARRRAATAFAFFLVAAGWTNFSWRTAILQPHDLRILAMAPEEIASLRGRLREPPELHRHERAGRWFTNSMALLECEGLRKPDGDWQPAAGLVVVFTPAALDPVFARQTRVTVSGVLRRPEGPAAPGLFDYASHLRWCGIYFELRTQAPGDWEAFPEKIPAGASWADAFQTWAKGTLALGLPEQDTELGLLWAMTLGWKTGLTDEVEEPFMQSGTMHIFAISGLHIALITSIIGQFLRMLQVPRIAIGVALLPAVWFYTAATGWQPSAVRASVMTSVVVGGWMLSRPTNVLNALATAALIVLAWEPRELFRAGFQLSFAVVASLGLLMPVFDAVRHRITASDPFLPEERVPRWQRVLRLGLGWLSAACAVSLASWIGSIPLTAHWFHLFTPSSLIANLVVVPLSSLALASNLGSLACGLWAPSASELFNHSAWFWMHLMLAASSWAAALPGGFWYVREPPPAAVVLWYLGLMSIGLGCWRLPRWRWRLAVASVLLGLIAARVWLTRHWELRVVVLPLRGGHAVWTRHPAGQFLVDTGDENAAVAITRPFLHAQGVNRLPALVLTHGDIRHVGGAARIAEEFRPRQAAVSPVRFRSKVYRSVVDQWRARRDGRLITLARGEAWVGMTVLHPGADDRVVRADDGPLVLDLAIQGTRILLTSDLSRRGQEEVATRFPDLRTDVVVCGLDDRGNALNQAWLDQLAPRIVIVADASSPATARASATLRDRLRRRAGLVLFTSETGSLDLRWENGSWRVLDAGGRLLGRVAGQPTAHVGGFNGR